MADADDCPMVGPDFYRGAAHGPRMLARLALALDAPHPARLKRISKVLAIVLSGPPDRCGASRITEITSRRAPVESSYSLFSPLRVTDSRGR